MDSIKSFKGYGKVDPAENREFRRKSRKRLLLIGISAALLILIIVGVVVGVVANKRGDGSGSSSPASAASNTIKLVCSVTRYPDSCYSSLSSVAGSAVSSDPEQLFKLSLRVAIDAISNVSSLPDTLLVAAGAANDQRLQMALKDCKELFDDAVDRLNTSLAALTPAAKGEKLLTKTRIDDMKTWLSAAITDQDTCLDGFEGTAGEVRDRMAAAMTNSTQFTSNSLAIVAGILGILQKLNFPVHRKLLSTGGEMPAWVSGFQSRVLLQESPAALTPNVTVAQDGTGQVTTITAAVEMVPKKSLEPFVIYVKAGEYKENVVLDKNKWNVVIFGDGMFKTTIVGSLNFIEGTPTFSTATFATVGKGFMARDVGFRNIAGPEKHQAVAMRSASDQSVFYRCSFDAFQDTLYAHSNRQFYRECDITGTIDFIFGNSAVIFQKCTIRPRQPLPNQQNTITAQGRIDPNQNTGISIEGCTISPYDSVTAPTYLGRPWKNYSVTVIMQTEIGALVNPAGWMSWVPGTEPPATIGYAEYQNTGPGAGTAGRVAWPGYRPMISADEANKYTVEEFIKGNEWLPETGVAFTSTL